MDGRTLNVVSAEPVSRQERKQRTRQALLDAALGLLADRPFASLSLREVAKGAGIVPTAFYRHFASMDELGVALVEEATRTLRGMIRSARADPATYQGMISASRQGPRKFRIEGAPILRAPVALRHYALRGPTARLPFAARDTLKGRRDHSGQRRARVGPTYAPWDGEVRGRMPPPA